MVALLPHCPVLLVQPGPDQPAVVLTADRPQRVALEAVARVTLVVAGGIIDELADDLLWGAGALAGGDAEGGGTGDKRGADALVPEPRL
jgi:hypothetical protein